MCGIVSILTKRQNGFFSMEADAFQQMLYADAVRGWDATGVYGITKEGNVDIKKQACAASVFVSSTEFENFKKKIISSYHAVIGHNRKATHGEKRNEDAHPFWDKDRKIVLVHNGMISNHKDFCKDSTIDSAAIANAMATMPAKHILSEITGAYAFIWYDVAQKKVFFARNESRPLYIVETEDLFALMSEPQLAGWTLSRNNMKVIAVKPVEDHMVYEYDISTHKITECEKYEQKKIYSTTTYRNIGATTTSNVIYLPQQITPPHKQRQMSALFNTYEVVDVDPSCFLSNKDLINQDKAIQEYTIGDIIYVQISTYQEETNTKTGEVNVALVGQPINITHPWLVCKARLSKHEFDLIDLTEVFEFTVCSTIRNKEGHVILYGRLGDYVENKETNNGVVITESMWFHDEFPDKCDLCRLPLHYKDLTESTIELEQHGVKHALCPVCTAKYESTKEK